MKSSHQQARQLDARQLILDADFETLAISESRVIEMARQWTVQVSSWLSTEDDLEGQET